MTKSGEGPAFWSSAQHERTLTFDRAQEGLALQLDLPIVRESLGSIAVRYRESLQRLVLANITSDGEVVAPSGYDENSILFVVANQGVALVVDKRLQDLNGPQRDSLVDNIRTEFPGIQSPEELAHTVIEGMEIDLATPPSTHTFAKKNQGSRTYCLSTRLLFGGKQLMSLRARPVVVMQELSPITAESGLLHELGHVARLEERPLIPFFQSVNIYAGEELAAYWPQSSSLRASTQDAGGAVCG